MAKYHRTPKQQPIILTSDTAGLGYHDSIRYQTRFHDLDELMSSSLAIQDQPSWVQEREINDLTCEISWDVIRRFDGRESLHSIHSLAKYVGGLYQVYDAIKKGHNRLLDKIKNSPKYLYYEALIEGSRVQPYYGKMFLGKEHAEPSSAYRECIKWQGTPEENLRLLTAAAKYYGAQEIGVIELNQVERKLLFTYPRGNNRPPLSYGKAKATTDDFTNDWPPPNNVIKPIVFEDVSCGYEASTRYVIPSKPLWIISIMMGPTNPTLDGYSGCDANIYRNHTVVQACLQDFLRALGYQGMGYMDDTQGLLPATGVAVLAGLAEMTRNNNYCISPRYGTAARYFSMITDLPIAPTRPIDAGIFHKCHSCAECAELCPVDSISKNREPTWEVPTVNGIPNEYSGPGKKLYHANAHLCKKFSLEQSIECGICMTYCPFSASISID